MKTVEIPEIIQSSCWLERMLNDTEEPDDMVAGRRALTGGAAQLTFAARPDAAELEAAELEAAELEVATLGRSKACS